MARKAPDQDAGEALRRFKSDLKAGTLGNFYIISGEEAFLRSHYVDLITKKIADGPAGEFNCHRFSADDCTPQALADAIDAMPMMAERTLVRVDDVDLFKQPEGAREQYAAIFSDLPDYCCVLFVYDTVEFKINGTMKKLAAAIREHAQILTFGKQSERDLCAWITRHFRAHDKMVTDDLCQYLIFRTDGLMTTLAGEIDKIAAYQQGPAITRGAIDAVVIPALSAQTFDISDAVVKEDFETALSKLQELYAMQTDPIAVLGAIGAQLRRLFYARVILSAGGGQKELMELTGLKSYPAGLTMTAARRVTDGFCQKAVELVLQADGGEHALVGARRAPGGQRDAHAAARRVGQAHERVLQIGGGDGARGHGHVDRAGEHAVGGPVILPAHELGRDGCNAALRKLALQDAQHAPREVGGHHEVPRRAQRHRQRAGPAAHVEHRFARPDGRQL